jgi:serine/threonine protein kinase
MPPGVSPPKGTGIPVPLPALLDGVVLLQVHQRLGDFEIIRLLGKGGMGEVYEAQQSNPRRRVALKVLAPWLAHDEDARQRFEREAAAPAQIDHPSIVRIISTGHTADGVVYYAMHLVRGISLAELIRQGTPGSLPATAPAATVSQAGPAEETPSQGPAPSNAALPPSEGVPAVLREYLKNRSGMTARLGLLAARALAAAHRQGFLHRDIKPSNLMVDQHGHLYVLDFGLTRMLAAGALGTRPGAVLGTPWFMSPEQARGDTVDPRSDLYSLGVTLYQLTTVGLGPFSAHRDDPEAVLAQVRAGMHLPLRSLAPAVPQELERIITRAIHPKAKRRYQHADELAADLERFLGAAPVVGSSLPSRTYRGLRKPAYLVGGAFLLALLMVFGLSVGSDLFHSKEENARGKNAAVAKDEPLYPDSLKNRKTKFPVTLLSQDFEPLWYRLIAGDGRYYCTVYQLTLHSPYTKTPTFLALDDDPQRRWFEFSIALMQLLDPQNTEKNQLGLFFGWTAAEADGFPRVFALQLDEQAVPGYPHGRLTIGSTRIHSGKGSRGEMNEGVRAFHPVEGIVPLKKSKSWHKLRVAAEPRQIKVVLDEDQVQLIDRSLAGCDPEIAALDPRGGLGIWAANGVGHFKEATITALPER